MYILFDKSGSMIGAKWFDSTAALQTFFGDPNSAGLRVALRFFPEGGCDSGCNVGACAQPNVAAGELTAVSAPSDVQEQKLLDAFVGVDPGGGTPMSAALDGGIQWAQAALASNPLEKAVVVLVTDGVPEDCNTSSSYLTNAAAGAFNGSGIQTFAIGLEGSDAALLDAIAAAGGTDKSIVVSATNGQQELADALNKAREASSACEFEVPDGDGNMSVDPGKVNVVFKPSSGGQQTIGKVADGGGCGMGGWYYDSPSNPSRIILCPESCAALQLDPSADVEVLLGCTSVPA
jgi:uncharacterized protein YegL